MEGQALEVVTAAREGATAANRVQAAEEAAAAHTHAAEQAAAARVQAVERAAAERVASALEAERQAQDAVRVRAAAAEDSLLQCWCSICTPLPPGVCTGAQGQGVPIPVLSAQR